MHASNCSNLDGKVDEDPSHEEVEEARGLIQVGDEGVAALEEGPQVGLAHLHLGRQ